MLKLSDLKKSERLRRTVNIYEHKVTFSLRGPNALELVEVGRSGAATRDRILAAAAEGRTKTITSDEMGETISLLSEMVLNVEGVDKTWAEMTDVERRELIAAIPMRQFWSLYNDTMQIDALEESEKKD